MRVQFVPEKAELSLFDPKKRVVVENSDGAVVITAGDNFSAPDKVCLIRYLAAEGFILDDFQDYGKSGKHIATPITWTVEQPEAKREPRLNRANRFMIRLLISASVLWLGLMIFAFLHAGH